MAGWRRASLTSLAALVLAAAIVLGAWAVHQDDGAPSARNHDPIAHVAADGAAGTTTSTAAVAEPGARPTPAPSTSAALPVPQDAPEDPYAPTPVTVHGTLELPTLGVEQPLHEGVTLTAIDRGPSHWPGTALPGEAGNVVVAGHRTTHTRPFLDLDRLRPGDPLVFTTDDGRRFTYRHTGNEVVPPDGTHIVVQSPERTATLFACHPKGSAALRIVAHFELAS